MLKRLITLFLVANIIAAGLVIAPGAVGAVNVDVWTDSSLAGIFKDDVKLASSGTQISLVAARNEYESAQIAIRAAGTFNISSVVFSNLVCGSNTIAGTNLRYNYVDYMYLTSNSTFGGAMADPTRKTPGYFPEYLLNDAARNNIPANTTQPIWITVYVPKGTVAGTYTGTVTVNTSLGNNSVNISVEVANVEIPDPASSTYTMSNWTWTSGWQGEATDQVCSQYGYTKYSTQWWSLMEKMAASMKEHRMNQFWVHSADMLKDGGSTVAADGTITFNWSKFDQVIQFFIDAGVVKRLEDEHLLLKNSSDSYEVWGLKRNPGGSTITARMTYNSAEANSYLRQYLTAVKAHLISKGWWGMWTFYVADEPIGDAQRTAWMQVFDNYVNVYAPGARVNCAFTDSVSTMQSTLQGRLNIWVPLEPVAENDMAYFHGRQALGEEYWDYYCIGPTAAYYNRFVDQQLARVRLHSWWNYNYGMTGTLHWAWNYWTLPNDNTGTSTPGDNGIVYPDVANANIKNTLRHDAIRDGAEEYELFKILEANNSALAHKIASTVAPSAQNSALDRNFILMKHAELVRAAAGQTVQNGTLDAFSLIQAENISENSGIAFYDAVDNGESQYVGNTHNGDYVAYDSIDFGNGALGAEFRVAAEVNGGTVEIRLDSLNGPLVGMVKVPITGSWQTWVTQRVAISGASGVHKVYLKFVNTSTAYGLYNINWFKFTRYNNALEAENAALSGGAAFNNSFGGYTGTGFVAGYLAAGAATTFTVSDIPSAGTYCVDLRYSNAYTTAKTLSLYVNGTKIRQISLGSTSSWSTWGIRKDYVSLNAGANTIAYKYDSTDSGNVNIDSIQAYPLGFAYLKPVTVSSVYASGYEAAKAVDGDWSSRWSSAFSDPQWIYVDLSTVRTISKVCITWEAAYGKSYKIQVSNDAANWTDVYSTTQGDGGIDDINLSPVTGRYVRMYGTQRGTTYGYSIYELEVYGNQ